MNRRLRNMLIGMSVLLLIVVIISAAWGWGGGGDFWGGRMNGAMWVVGLPFMVLFWGLLILGIVALVRWLNQPTVGSREGPGETALDILSKRYARGDIGKEEFEQKKRDLA